MTWSCKFCCMPVRTSALRCPRCRRRWPGLTREHFRQAAAWPVFTLMMAAGVVMAWVAAFSR